MHATCVDLRTDLIRIKSWYYQLFLFQIVFAIYMLMTTIILINLLIAMMSDTYQRIQVYKWVARVHPLIIYNFSNNQIWSGSLDTQNWSRKNNVYFGSPVWPEIICSDMSKTDMAPAPINLFTSWITYFAKACKKGE